MSQGFKRGNKWRTSSSTCMFLWLIQQFPVAVRSTSPDMTTVFHTWPDGRFMEIQSNLRRNRFHKMNQGSNFLWGSFNSKPQSNLEKKVNPSILKDDFSSRADPSIFISMTTVIWDQSNETSWIFPALTQ